MAKYKTTRGILDRPKPLELILDLASFSGGENTRGEDIALKNNEARIIENWDALTIGGIIRSKGFNEVASVANVDSYTKALIHFQGADAAVAAVETISGKAITFVGTAQLDTAQKPFGLSSLLLDGNSDYVTLADHADWNFGTGDFTIDLQLRLAVDQDSCLIGQYEDANNYWYFRYSDTNGKLEFFHKDGGTTRADYSVAWAPAVDTWYHLECGRNGANFYMFIDGTSQTLTETTAISTNDLGDISAVLAIGAQNGAYWVNGWISEVRVVKGTCRHTATFTAPSEEYVPNAPLDLLVHHIESTSTQLYGIIKGDLVYKDSSDIKHADASGFTSGQLSSGISAGDKLWITNSQDNLKYKTIAGDLTTPDDQPAAARERVHYHQSRLLVEGGGRTVYGSRAGTGNWTAADAWTLANDAWDLAMPQKTYGGVSAFPSGQYFTIFTYFKAYLLSNFPDTRYEEIPNSKGCCAPHSIAKGDEGIYFLSNHPTLGVYLWNGVNWTELSVNHDFVEEIVLSKRIYGYYRDNKYYLNYNKSGSTVSYPNRTKIFDATLGRWMERPLNSNLSEGWGYPALLLHENNELYNASSVNGRIYELETTDNSDETENTKANYLTKHFNSADFFISGGEKMPVSNVRMKFLKMILTYYGDTGNITVGYDIDKGRQTGSQTFTMTTDVTGDLLNSTFIVNTSSIVGATSLPDKTVVRTFANKATGRRIQIQILNEATGTRPKVKSLKIHAIALEEL